MCFQLQHIFFEICNSIHRLLNFAIILYDYFLTAYADMAAGKYLKKMQIISRTFVIVSI